MGQQNPWLTTTEEPVAVGAAAPAASTPAHGGPTRRGPAQPQRGVDELDAVDRLPRRTPRASATLWWLGAHGGAGETTLAELLPGSRAADHCWPAEADPVIADPVTVRPVVLLCRGHARGLHAAQTALTDWASGAVPGVHLLGLVIVADAPQRTPKPLRDLARVVSGGAPAVWHLPWIEALRYAPVAATATPSAARGLLRDITRLTGSTTHSVNHTAPTREDSP